MKKIKQSILYKKWLEEREKSKAESEKETQEKQEFEKKQKYMDKAVRTMKRYKRQIRVAVLVMALIMAIFGSSLYGAKYGEKVIAAQFREDMQEAVGSAGTAGELTTEQKDTLIDEILTRIKDMIHSGEIQYQGTFSEEDIQKIKESIEGELLQQFREYLTKDEVEQIIQNVLSSIENTYTTSEELLQQIENVNKEFYEIKTEIDSLEQDFQNFKNEVNVQIEQKIDDLKDRLEHRIEVNEDSILEIRQQIIDLRKEYDLKFSEFENTYNQKLEEITSAGCVNSEELEKRVSANEQAIADIQKQMKDMQRQISEELAALEEAYNAKLEELAEKIDVDIEALRIEFKADFADFESVYDIKLTESEKNLNARLNVIVANTNAALEALRKELKTDISDTNDNVTLLQQGLSDANAAITTLKTELKKDISDIDNTLTMLAQRVTVNENNIGTMSGLKTGNKSSLVNAVNEVFQLVSDGKKLLASTITDKGVATAEDATFEVMSENIKRIADAAYNDGYNQGISSVQASISEFYLQLNFRDYSGPLGVGGFINYVTFDVSGAESVTIESTKITVESEEEPEFAKLGIQIRLDDAVYSTIGEVTDYTIPVSGKSTMQLRMINTRGSQAVQSTAVIKNLKINKPSKMARGKTISESPKLKTSGLIMMDSKGNEISMNDLFDAIEKESDVIQEETELAEEEESESESESEIDTEESQETETPEQSESEEMEETESDMEETEESESDGESEVETEVEIKTETETES